MDSLLRQSLMHFKQIQKTAELSPAFGAIQCFNTVHDRTLHLFFFLKSVYDTELQVLQLPRGKQFKIDLSAMEKTST